MIELTSLLSIIEDRFHEKILRDWFPDIIYCLLCKICDPKKSSTKSIHLKSLGILVNEVSNMKSIKTSFDFSSSNEPDFNEMMKYLNDIANEFDWTLRNIPAVIAWRCIPSQCSLIIPNYVEINVKTSIIFKLQPPKELNQNVFNFFIDFLFEGENKFKFEIPEQFRQMIQFQFKSISNSKIEFELSVFGNKISNNPYSINIYTQTNVQRGKPQDIPRDISVISKEETPMCSFFSFLPRCFITNK